MHNLRGLSAASCSKTSQLQPAEESKFAQRRYFSELTPSVASCQSSGAKGNTCRKCGS